MNFDNKFLDEIISSYSKVLVSFKDGKNFNRSPKKVDNLHARIADDLNLEFIKSGMDKKYMAWSKISNNKETKINGRYYDKKADVAIVDLSKKNTPTIGIIELKFVLSSLYKNLSNYFEQSMGECVNIKMKGYKYYDVNIFLSNTPSFSNNGLVTGNDVVNSKKFYNYIARSNADSTQDPKKITVPNKSLFMVIKNSIPFINEKKDIFISREFNFFKKTSRNELYDDTLFENANWGKDSLINQYSEFILEIKKDILKGEN